MNKKEINTILAEKAMQWTLIEKPTIEHSSGMSSQWYERGKFIHYEQTWDPWNKTSQALQVAKKMTEYVNAADRFEISGGKDIFTCRFIRFAGVGAESTMGLSTHQPKLQHAICLATLDALGIETGEENGQEETS